MGEKHPLFNAFVASCRGRICSTFNSYMALALSAGANGLAAAYVTIIYELNGH